VSRLLPAATGEEHSADELKNRKNITSIIFSEAVDLEG
jgi:hypothetical protein